MAYVKLSKEDWRQRYNARRQQFMKKYGFKASQVAAPLSKEDVRGMSKEQIRDMASLFTKPMSATMELESGERISQSGLRFQTYLIEGTINPSRERRYEAIKDLTYHAGGLDVGRTELQSHMPRFDEFKPLKEKTYRSLSEARRHMRRLKAKVYDPTKDERFKEGFLKALYRSAMPEEDKYDIAMAVKTKPAEEIARLAMTYDEFDIAYVYSEVFEATNVRTQRLREALGIVGKHYEAGGVSEKEKLYYEGYTTKAGNPFRDKKGNITMGYDINRVYRKIYGRDKR